MKKETTEQILKGLTLNKKYNAIGAFLESTFNVTNEAIPTMTKANPIMSKLVLNELRTIEAMISKDIESIKLMDIDVMDITTERVSELSFFVYDLMVMGNAYSYKGLVDDLKAYQKAMRLQEVFPLDKRKIRLEELQNDIKATEEIIESLREVDEIIAGSYGGKLLDLKKEYEAIKETIYFKGIEEIRVETYSKVISRLSTTQERVQYKIAFLERILGSKYE